MSAFNESGVTIADYVAEDDAEETLKERLAGLAEMFPEKLRNQVSVVCEMGGKAINDTYRFSRTYSWIFFSSAAIMCAPVIIQAGLQDFEEMAKAQQRQLLLGANPMR